MAKKRSLVLRMRLQNLGHKPPSASEPSQALFSIMIMQLEPTILPALNKISNQQAQPIEKYVNN